jgi:hypothetical protein
MKVHVYGNTLNSAYHLTKVLRDKGIDAEMFLDNSSSSEQDFPWWDDETLKRDNLPTWIHYYPIFPNYFFRNHKTKKMIDDFAKCDVALVSCYGPMLAMKAKIPFVFYSLGSDLNMIDFKDDLNSLLFNTYSLKSKVLKFIKLLTYGRLQLKALKSHANRIIIYAGYQYLPYIVKHGLQDKTVKLNYPKDVINYGVGVDEQLNSEYKHYDFVFFMFSRHSWKSVWNDIKGNDKFIRAFARFVKENNPNAILITANKGIDIDASKSLIKELGIEECVQWLDDIPKYQFKKYQALPNIVMVDNFWHDKWYERYTEGNAAMHVCLGFGGVETLSSKSLLITTFADQEFYDGESPQILNAFTEEEIFNRLIQLSKMSTEEKNQMKQAGYDFVLKWNEQTAIIHKHIDVLREVYLEVGG